MLFLGVTTLYGQASYGPWEDMIRVGPIFLLDVCDEQRAEQRDK